MERTGLEQNMKQNMVASAAMQLFMRTLQASATELHQIATQAVNSNPALELSEIDTAGSSSATTDELRHNYLINNLVAAPSLRDYLEEQIRQSALPAATERTAMQLAQHLDRRGFFETPPATIAETEGIPAHRLHSGLAALRDLDPPGIGALDLRDSLMLQLNRRGESNGLPMQLLEHHWEALVRHKYADTAAKLGLREDEIIAAAQRIARLNPNPGSGFEAEEKIILRPDIIVERDGDKLSVQLTGENIPKLALSAAYRDMMAEQADKQEVRQYLSRCFREGRELIRAIEQRQHTILKVAEAIVTRQRDFFLKGEQHLRPLKMDDIAADTGLHTSTVSRAVNGKYLRFERKLSELRRFFTAALPTAAEENISADSVKSRIRDMIAAESPAKPLSDARLEALLAAEGIQLARRTIAKYREQLHILPAHLRRRA